MELKFRGCAESQNIRACRDVAQPWGSKVQALFMKLMQHMLCRLWRCLQSAINLQCKVHIRSSRKSVWTLEINNRERNKEIIWHSRTEPVSESLASVLWEMVELGRHCQRKRKQQSTTWQQHVLAFSAASLLCGSVVVGCRRVFSRDSVYSNRTLRHSIQSLTGRAADYNVCWLCIAISWFRSIEFWVLPF